MRLGSPGAFHEGRAPFFGDLVDSCTRVGHVRPIGDVDVENRNPDLSGLGKKAGDSGQDPSLLDLPGQRPTEAFLGHQRFMDHVVLQLDDENRATVDFGDQLHAAGSQFAAALSSFRGDWCARIRNSFRAAFAETARASYNATVGWSRNRRPRRLFLWIVVLLVAGGAYLDFRVRRGFEDAGWVGSVRFWAAPVVVKAGVPLGPRGLAEILTNHAYVEVDADEMSPGEFSVREEFVEVFVRPVPQPTRFAERPAQLLRLVFRGGSLRLIRDARTGSRLAEMALAPRPVPGVLSEHWAPRVSVRLDEVPPVVVDALLAAEDAHFLDHPGVNLKSMLRAMKVNWEAGRIRQGGSTLTQQFVKNHYLTQDRTFSRKLLEIPMALLLEQRFSKEQILEAYIGTVYLGHDRLVGVHGLAEGSRVFLGKPLADATAADGALLAGLIRAPNIYSPLRHPERALRRRDQILAEMRDLGWIDDRQYLVAIRTPLPEPFQRQAAPEAFFMQEVFREMDAAGWAPAALGTGSQVFTTLNVSLQSIVADEVRKLARGRKGLEVEVVALNPENGALLALQGGSDFLASQLDRSARPHSPAGSIFKPFLLLAAFSLRPAALTPESVFADEPLALEVGGVLWEPTNADGKFRGPVTLRESLARSLNLPMVRLAQDLGLETVAEFADGLPLSEKPLPRVPALALGSFPVSLRDVTRSFAMFSQEGSAPEINAVLGIKAPSGAVVFAPAPEERIWAAPAAVAEVHDLLVDVADEGTARAIQARGLVSDVAGKTGTTNESRVVWFVGYVPDLLVGIRVAFDDGRPLGADAAGLAVPLWSRIVRRAQDSMVAQETRFSGARISPVESAE